MANSPTPLSTAADFFASETQSGGARNCLKGRDYGVIGDGLRLHQTQRETILGDVGNSRGDGFAIAREGDG